MTVALVTGVTGQDGTYLAEYLYGLGTKVWGMTRTGVVPDNLSFVHPTPAADLRDYGSLTRAVDAASPDEVYHLAAQSSVGESWEDPIGTADITGLGTVRLLEAVRQVAPAARVFLASSSEVFGEPDHAPQDEQSPIRPVSPYGVAKAYAHHLARVYRQRYGLYVAIGILYNHESPRRSLSFVTRKISHGAVAIARAEQSELRLGNLEVRRDWGFAGDYVRAMHLMLQHKEPDEYVVATGEVHSVREFCEATFARVGLDYRAYVVSDKALWRPAERIPLVGDNEKIQRLLGWSPTVPFLQLVEMLVDAEQRR